MILLTNELINSKCRLKGPYLIFVNECSSRFVMGLEFVILGNISFQEEVIRLRTAMLLCEICLLKQLKNDNSI